MHMRYSRRKGIEAKNVQKVYTCTCPSPDAWTCLKRYRRGEDGELSRRCARRIPHLVVLLIALPIVPLVALLGAPFIAPLIVPLLALLVVAFICVRTSPSFVPSLYLVLWAVALIRSLSAFFSFVRIVATTRVTIVRSVAQDWRHHWLGRA